MLAIHMPLCMAELTQPQLLLIELPQAGFVSIVSLCCKQQRCELHDAIKVLLVALQDEFWCRSPHQQRHDAEAASHLHGEMRF